MKKQTIEIDFIEFDDIQVGDVFSFYIGMHLIDYDVVSIEKDRIILHNKGRYKPFYILKENFDNYFNLRIENGWDGHKVLTIRRRLDTIWQCVENQSVRKLGRDKYVPFYT